MNTEKMTVHRIGMLITLFILAICAAYFAVKLIVCGW